WHVEKHTIAVEPDQTPPAFDLSTAGRPAAKGIYALLGPGMVCANCHKSPFGATGPWQLPSLCPPALKHSTAKDSSVLQIAISTLPGPRPSNFGSKAEGVVEFLLERVAPDAKDERENLSREKERIEAFLAAMKLRPDDEEVRRATARLAVI